jgi:hypothetical protein
MADSTLEILWKHALDHWDNDAAHRAFLEHCQKSDQLVEAAVRYRGMKGDHARGALAETKLTAITALAFARLELARTPERKKHGRLVSIVLIACFFMGIIGLLAYLGPRR